jgi:hypothetical protein
MNGADGKLFKNVSSNQGPFVLEGGTYGVSAVSAAWGDAGSVTLEMLDGTTWVPLLPAFTANSYGSISLPPGQYQLAVAGVTVSAAVTAIKP